MKNIAIAMMLCLIVFTPLDLSASESASHSVKAMKSSTIGLDGNCPVCLIKMDKVVKGDPKFSSTYDGVTYFFPGEKQKKMFDADPAAFVPALGGDCTVCKIEMGKAVPGKAEFSVLHDGRLFLFPGEKQMKMFEAAPAKYANADLALGGDCAVCLVKKHEQVKGSEKFTSYYDGMRYQFPGKMQKEMFDKNPTAFVPAMGGNCTVCKVEMGKDVKGKPEFFIVHEGRLYLFPGEEQMKMFSANRAKYANADLAMSGHCTVCKAEMGKDVKGKKEFSVDYNGKRYLFPSQKQLDMFTANPEKYAEK